MKAHCPAHPDQPLQPLDVVATDRFWGCDGTERFAYARCPTCGSWVLDPPPAPASLGRWYAGYYPEAELTWRRTAWRRWKPRRALGVDGMRALDIKARLAKLGLVWGPEVRVLDAGCGVGGFLAGLHAETGAQVEGVDFNPACRTFAREVYGVEVRTGELAAQGFPAGERDVVTSWHCLEHTYAPAAELAELRRLTRPGGYLVLEMPSPGFLARLFKGRWFFLQAPTHLYHLRPEALKTLLVQGGWEIKQMQRPWLPSEWAGSVMMALGVRRFVPTVMYGTGARNRLLRALFGLLMVVDVPLTFLLALAGATGGVRAVARRPEES